MRDTVGPGGLLEQYFFNDISQTGFLGPLLCQTPVSDRYGESMAHRLSLLEYVVLSLLTQQPSHGFALVKELGPAGGVGQIWSVPNPVVYRALRTLRADDLIVPDDPEASPKGPRRVIVRPTDHGTRCVEDWLARPVEHFRDVRVEFQLKLALLIKLGRDTKPLLKKQRAHFREFSAESNVFGSVRSKSAAVREDEERRTPNEDNLLWMWRQEFTDATMRFLDRALTESPPSSRVPGGPNRPAADQFA